MVTLTYCPFLYNAAYVRSGIEVMYIASMIEQKGSNNILFSRIQIYNSYSNCDTNYQ